MTTVSRTAYPRLPERASADELNTCFSLTAEDKAFILDNAKGWTMPKDHGNDRRSQ